MPITVTRASKKARPTAFGEALSSKPTASTPNFSRYRLARPRTWTRSSASRLNCRGMRWKTQGTVRVNSPGAIPASTWESATGITLSCSRSLDRRWMPISQLGPLTPSLPIGFHISLTWPGPASSTTPLAPVRWYRCTRRYARSRTARSTVHWLVASTSHGRSIISSPSAKMACCQRRARAKHLTLQPTGMCAARAARYSC